MKYLIAVLVSLFLSVIAVLLFKCDGHADPYPPIQVKAAWSTVSVPYMSHYDVYFWQGSDTTAWSPTLMIKFQTVSHNDTLAEHTSDLYDFTFDYLICGCKAVNQTGDESTMSITRFYSYYEFAPPPFPVDLRVIRP